MNNILETMNAIESLPWYYDLDSLNPKGFVEFLTIIMDFGISCREARKIALKELSLRAMCTDIEDNPGRYTFSTDLT